MEHPVTEKEPRGQKKAALRGGLRPRRARPEGIHLAPGKREPETYLGVIVAENAHTGTFRRNEMAKLLGNIPGGNPAHKHPAVDSLGGNDVRPYMRGEARLAQMTELQKGIRAYERRDSEKRGF